LALCRYKNDPEILAMTNLIAAYQRNEIIEFERILKVKSEVLLGCFFNSLYMKTTLMEWFLECRVTGGR